MKLELIDKSGNKKKGIKTMFIIRDREAGNQIDVFNTKEDAEKALAGYEAEDCKDGTYEEDFYEIVEGEE